MRSCVLVFLLVGFAFGLVGCPQSNVEAPKEEPPPGPVDQAGQPGATTQGVWEFDLSKMAARVPQEEIAKGDFFKLTGTVHGECSGNLRIDIIENADSNTAAGSAPLTTLDMDNPGQFEILVPKGLNLSISGCCDADKDGKIIPEVDQFIVPMELVAEKENNASWDLYLGAIPRPGQQPAPRPGGPEGSPAK